jgi:hypothetical protein
MIPFAFPIWEKIYGQFLDTPSQLAFYDLDIVHRGVPSVEVFPRRPAMQTRMPATWRQNALRCFELPLS